MRSGVRRTLETVSSVPQSSTKTINNTSVSHAAAFHCYGLCSLFGIRQRTSSCSCLLWPCKSNLQKTTTPNLWTLILGPLLYKSHYLISFLNWVSGRCRHTKIPFLLSHLKVLLWCHRGSHSSSYMNCMNQDVVPVPWLTHTHSTSTERWEAVS